MRTSRKHVLALLLILALSLSLFPATAFAGDLEEPEDEGVIAPVEMPEETDLSVPEEESPESPESPESLEPNALPPAGDETEGFVAFGTCGEYVDWSLNEDGLLSITGTGEMASCESAQPWEEYRSQVLSVVIAPGVTSIGNYAFYYCDKLTQVSIPSGVTSIGSLAFGFCSSLPRVSLPESVTDLGNGVFTSCTALSELMIPESVTVIPGFFCSSCINLTKVTIPSSVWQIGSSAFKGCANLTELSLPAGVTEICGNAFSECRKLESLSLPSTIVTIGDSAFFHCDSLTSLSIPAGVRTISGLAFGYCSAIAEIRFWGDAPSIAADAFSSVSATVYYPVGNTSWTASVRQSYGGSLAWLSYQPVTASGSCGEALSWTLYADGLLTVSGTGDMDDYGNHTPPSSYFYSRTPWLSYRQQITRLVVEDGVGYIGFGAFRDLDQLLSAQLPDSVASIGIGAFNRCSSLRSVALPSGLTEINNSLFFSCTSLSSLTIPASVTRIDNSAFSGCSGLTSLTIPAAVTSIGPSAFSRCSGLTSLTIPSAVTRIENSAFSGCSGLTSLTIPAAVTSIESSVFSGCSGLSSLTIPSAVTSIGSFAFSGCTGLSSLTIPAAVTSIGDYAFSGCTGLRQILVQYGSTSFRANAGVLFSADMTSLLFYPPASYLSSYTIPDGVTRIESYAFQSANNLTELSFPVSLELIGAQNFDTTSSLRSLYFAGTMEQWKHVLVYGGNNLIRTGPIHCSDGDYTVPADACGPDLTWSLSEDKVLTISGCGPMWDYKNINGSYYSPTFSDVPVPWGYGELRELHLPEGLTRIGHCAFAADYSGDTILSAVALPDSLQSIGASAFYYRSGLVSIEFPSALSEIGESAFGNCTALKEIRFTGDAPTINRYAFSGVSAVVYYPAGNDSWTEEVRQNYGGTLRWVPVFTGLARLSDVKGRPGEEIVLSVDLSANPGVFAVSCRVVYDDSVLSFLGVENGSLSNWTADTDSGYLLLESEAEEDQTAADGVVRLHFRILDAAQDGETRVSLADLEAFNLAEEQLFFRPESGTVTISSRLPGDINYDGEINLLDLVRLRKYLIRVTSDINFSNADVTGDGTVNSADLVRMRKFLAGVPGTVLD